ncbi:EscC/YscC/HrcC family type III secretion system outer membrane ring protein [Photobacterium proteolyticum]|uniref:Type 3 secretion system secretin n=1 Tax=Photobacterium proteolyticum TaxID=1903952 RepID=A0A1Q9H1G6_9GAMM|nr:EscC/YscC/HrcC family type III secretion system outer membrane ring protein [Photobacterium proteolyticum]
MHEWGLKSLSEALFERLSIWLRLSSKRPGVSFIAILLLLCVGFLSSTPAWPQSLPRSGYQHIGQDEPLADVLKGFSANYRLSAVVSECISEKFNGQVAASTAEHFLSQLQAAFGFIWFRYGNTLYFNCGSEMQTKVLTLKRMSPAALKQAMGQVGLDLDRFGWRSLQDKGLLLVSGPPRFVDIVEQVATGLDEQAKVKQAEELQTYVVPLYFAWAGDRQVGDGKTVPGVATTLRKLMGYNSQDSIGRIESDESRNAVLLRDTQSNIDRYIRMIHAMDRALKQVEIGVTIIDIKEDALEEFGIDWGINGSSGSLSYQGGVISGVLGDGLNLSTIIGANITGVLFRLKALESQSKARMLSRPSLLTQENTEAVLDNSETFYARVTSKEDAQLVPLTAGTKLTVTPRVIPDKSGDVVKLDIQITDGKTTDERVDNLPTIKGSFIKTEAMVRKGQSLLIGGYFVDSETMGTDKVPVLGDIPMIGALFSQEKTTTSRMVRLFLIRPKVLEPGLNNLAEARQQYPELRQIVPGVAEVEALEQAFVSGSTHHLYR